jgi:hypothetical protein
VAVIIAKNHVRMGSTTKMRSPRKGTVSKFAAALDPQHVIHVRETPGSGKTTLSRHLKDYYLENHRRVFLLPLWEPLTAFNGKDSWAKFASCLQYQYPNNSSAEFPPSNTVILIDDAQESYRDRQFWGIIIRNRLSRADRGVPICSE